METMDWGNIIFWAVCIFAAVTAYGLRNRISEIIANRNGIEVRTKDNEIPMYSEIVDKIEQIDASTCRSIRKATTGLMILDPEKHDVSADVMLVNNKANTPLINAAYENHHTRDLAGDNGIDNYIADKVHDVKIELQMWKKKFPELTGELIEEHISHWIKKAVIPNLKQACKAKLAYYRVQIKRDDVSTSIKKIVQRCIEKNERYLTCIEELFEHSNFKTLSGITQPL